MDIQVPPVPNQAETFRFSPRTFDVKKPEKRSIQPSWFDSRPWLHYDEAKDLALRHLCMLAYRDRKLRSLNLDKAFIINGFSNWKDACVHVYVRKHESSKCHQETVFKVETLLRTCGDIGEIHEIASKKHAVYVKLAKFLAKMTEILPQLLPPPSPSPPPPPPLPASFQNALKRSYRRR